MIFCYNWQLNYIIKKLKSDKVIFWLFVTKKDVGVGFVFWVCLRCGISWLNGQCDEVPRLRLQNSRSSRWAFKAILTRWASFNIEGGTTDFGLMQAILLWHGLPQPSGHGIRLGIWEKEFETSDGIRSKIFDPSRVGSIFCWLDQVSHLWFGSGFGKFLLKTWVEDGSSSYLLQVKSMLGLGRVTAHLYLKPNTSWQLLTPCCSVNKIPTFNG